jgi:uncharacterized protein YndB with AHSA1/START domain
MTTAENPTITVSVTINAPIEFVWEVWTNPTHITKWNAASDDWHTTKADNDLRVGGKFVSRMESKDGVHGFDFDGHYTKVDNLKQIDYTISDGRNVSVMFKTINNQTIVTESFQAESTNPIDLQQLGWQAILDNFKKYAENLHTFKKLHFEIIINSSVDKVFRLIFNEKNWNEWTSIFNPTSHYIGKWEKGSKILFVGTDKNGNKGGTVSIIKEFVPSSFVSIEHIGLYQNGEEIISGKVVQEWAGAYENYTFSGDKNNTLFQVDMDSNSDFEAYFSETWPKALAKLKEICER